MDTKENKILTFSSSLDESFYPVKWLCLKVKNDLDSQVEIPVEINGISSKGSA